MIAGFKCRDTENLKRTGESRRFRAFERVALRKLDMLDAAVSLDALRVPQGTAWRNCAVTGRANTASGSMTGGDCVLFGGTVARTTWKSWTTTRSALT